MERLSQLFDANRRDCPETKMDSPKTSSYPPSPIFPQSPQSIISSNAESPVASVFSSTKSHGRFPSASSSAASSPVMGSSLEVFPTMKTQLTDVKEEEPVEHETFISHDSGYFPDFNQVHADDSGYDSPVALRSHEYDLSDAIEEIANSPKKRHANNAAFKSISRISTRFSSMSSRWKQKNGSDTASTLERYEESHRSRANSATSTMASPTISSLSRRQSHHCPSPARTVFGERLSEAGIPPVDIDLANRQSIIDKEPQATTPLLPPLMTNSPDGENGFPLNSPLQSPSVADLTDSTIKTLTEKVRYGGLPSPPLSAQPSLSSIRPQPMDRRSQTVEVAELPPMILADPGDEWSNRLGHANFTIHPEPYLPKDYTVEILEEHRANWDLACHNYAKHLVRTGEHYGVTSNTYKLTEEKWRSIDAQWKSNHEAIITALENSNGRLLWLDKSNIRPGQSIKIPRLDKSKFPDLGDEDIVGPMEVAPPPQAPRVPLASTGKSLRKRTFFRFLQDLFCVSDPKS